MYELKPLPEQHQKSFWGKARVIEHADGGKTLISYETAVAKKEPDGTIVRLWGGWSVTTGKHIKAFCGLNKKDFFSLPYELTTYDKADAYMGTLFY